MGSFLKRQFFFVFLMPGNLASIQVVNLLLIVKLGCKHWSSFHSSDLASGHFGETALMEPCFCLGEGKHRRSPLPVSGIVQLKSRGSL